DAAGPAASASNGGGAWPPRMTGAASRAIPASAAGWLWHPDLPRERVVSRAVNTKMITRLATWTAAKAMRLCVIERAAAKRALTLHFGRRFTGVDASRRT